MLLPILTLFAQLVNVRAGQPDPSSQLTDPAPTFLAAPAGAWTAALTGPLAVKGRFSGPFGSFTPPGSTGGTTMLRWDSLFSASAGEYAGSATFGSGFAYPIAVSILPRLPFATFAAKPGCTNTGSNAYYHYNDNCVPITDAQPSVGGSVSMPLYDNSTWTRQTPPGYGVFYSARAAFPLDGRTVFGVQIADGKPKLFRDGVDLYPGATLPGIAQASWLSLLPEDSSFGTYYYITGAVLHKVVPPATDTTVIDLGAAPYLLPTGANQDAGATSGMTTDGWITVGNPDGTTTSSSRICAVNLRNTAETACTAAGELLARMPTHDWSAVSELDRQTGKRYVVVTGSNPLAVYVVEGTTLLYSHSSGPWPGTFNQVLSPHAALGLDASGNVILATGAQNQESWLYFATLRLSAGARMTRPAEEGGGLRLHYAMGPNNGSRDSHFSCAPRVARCSVSMYRNIADTAPDSSVGREVMIYDFGTDFTIRLGHVLTFTTPADNYWPSPKCSLGPWGDVIACNVNWGSGPPSIYTARIP